MKKGKVIFWAIFFVLTPFTINGAETGKFQYEDFKQPKRCGVCHSEIYQEWQQCLMSQSFTHEWDQVEYFKLALPHALKLHQSLPAPGPGSMRA
jgi:hypothetical protein